MKMAFWSFGTAATQMLLVPVWTFDFKFMMELAKQNNVKTYICYLPLSLLHQKFHLILRAFMPTPI